MTYSSDHYCTYFDHRYAAQGLAMIRSLRAHSGAGTIWVLCLSAEAEAVVAKFDLADLKAVSLAKLEAHFPDLAAARDDRSLVEYYFTLTPHIVRYVFDVASDAQRVAYLDGDLFFFGDAQQMWTASGNAPAVIIPHYFNRGAEHLRQYGTYNVGWVGFHRSQQGMAALDFWKDSCREWCHDTPNNGRFADQGYLDRFADFAPDTKVVTHKGCNLGPWNVGRYHITRNAGNVQVDEDDLIFFHFTGFKKELAGRWYNSHRIYRTGTTATVRDYIYRPYLAALLAARHFVEPLLPPVEQSNLVRNRGGGIPLKQRLYPLVKKAFQLWDLVTGRAIKEP